MKKLTHHQLTSLPIVSGFIAALTLLAFFVITVPQAQAASTLESGERLITIHDGGTEKGIVTKATTLRQAFATAGIPVSEHDRVEPGIDTPLTGNNYEINLYRARPVTIVDGGVQQRIMSPYRTPKQIVEHAGMTLNDEDETTMSASTDAVSGLGLRLTIDRATPFTLVLYGKSVPSHTMTRTVGDMLAEKKITLGANDTLSVPISTPITAGMSVELWRNGVQTQTREEDVAFTTKQIQDADQPVGYKKVQTPGVAGKKMVTYEITMKNGQELSRKEIQSVSTKQPSEQVEIIGTKQKSFGGSCGEWIAGAGITDIANANYLIGEESGCNPYSVNRSSGACGVGQALPCSKTGCEMGDGACQTRWMNSYVLGRYGSWQAAADHHRARGWY